MATFLEVSAYSEDEAREYMERIRWPEGPVCPHCGDVERAKRMGGNATRPGLFKCYSCRKQFTVTVGTVMHRTKVPLRKWAMAFHIVCASKKGVSALQLQRQLSLGSYQTAWHMAHRIRLAMREEPTILTGDVEAAETYVGGRRKGSKPGRSTEHKTPVFALVQRGGRVHSQVVPDVTAATLKGTMKELVHHTARVFTDEYGSYRNLDRHFASHETVSHKRKEYARGDAHVNTAESYFSLLKRGVMGAFHHVSRKHLNRYSDEFAFRWNRRHDSDAKRAEDAIRGADGKRLLYRGSPSLMTRVLIPWPTTV